MGVDSRRFETSDTIFKDDWGNELWQGDRYVVIKLDPIILGQKFLEECLAGLKKRPKKKGKGR